jgi:hypothetical protein
MSSSNGQRPGFGQRPMFQDFENLNGQRPWSRRSSEMKGLAKSQLKQSLSKVWPRAGSELALIPNETNKVRSHKINPKISGI